jgi:hypothetical protein
MMNRMRIVPAVMALLLVCAVGAVAAPPPPVDAKSRAVVEKMCTFMAAAKAFSVHADISNEQVLPSGVKIKRSAAGTLNVQRPNMLQATVVGDLLDRSFWYDGRSFSVLFPDSKLYVSEKAPPTLDGTMDWVLKKTGLAFPLLDYLYSDPLPGLLEGVRLSQYLGTSEVTGVKCTHLAFKQSTINWQVWVEDSDTPVPRRIVIEYKDQPGGLEYEALLSDWKFTETLPASLFVFTPPEGASRMQVAMSTPEVN